MSAQAQRRLTLEPAPADDAARRIHALVDHAPEFSAREVMTGRQLLIVYGTLTALLFGLAALPDATATVVVASLALLYFASFLFKTLLFLLGADEPLSTPAPVSAAGTLPIYTVLVPLYHEAAALPALLAALARLDYPSDRLDIKLILEEDDTETMTALAALRPPASVQIIRVPPTPPRTKPKALCYAMAFARGEFVVVYDAEDQPEPDQLRKALARFAAAGPQTACLQARLNFFNGTESWISRLFAIDYCLWFDHFLPGLESMGAPLPLGGTSNHFRRSALERVGGWDPYNVTEDADLGFRLARHGFAVRTLGSTTYEEAPTRIGPWLAQRSRWIKGYMQTYLVHMRAPRRLRREIGWRGLLSLHIFLLGTVVAGIANPILWGLFAGWVTTSHGILGGLTGDALLWASLIGLVAGNGMLVFLSLCAPLKRGWRDLVPYALTAPAYWLLISLAAWRALFEFIFRPFHWAKTPHGLTRYEARAQVSGPKEAA